MSVSSFSRSSSASVCILAMILFGWAGVGGFIPQASSAEKEVQYDNKPGKRTSFDETTPFAMVILSISVADADRENYRMSKHNMSVIWKKFDPETGKIIRKDKYYKDMINPGLKDGNFLKKKDVSKRQYRMFRLLPGDYLLSESNLMNSGGSVTSHNKYSYIGDTTSFHIEAGKIYFIGNYEFSFFQSNRGVVTSRTGYGYGVGSNNYARIDLVGHDMIEARAFLDKYKRFEGEIIVPELTPRKSEMAAAVSDLAKVLEDYLKKKE